MRASSLRSPSATAHLDSRCPFRRNFGARKRRDPMAKKIDWYYHRKG